MKHIAFIAVVVFIGGFWAAPAFAACNSTPRCAVDLSNPLQNCIQCDAGAGVVEKACRRRSMIQPDNQALQQQAMAALQQKCGGALSNVHPAAGDTQPSQSQAR